MLHDDVDDNNNTCVYNSIETLSTDASGAS